MHKNLAGHLAGYMASVNYEQISMEAVLRTKILLLDTIACGIAGYASQPGRIAREIAMIVHPRELPATILGTGCKSTIDLATFANGVMIRSLDLNDSYFSRDGGHPSDNFAPILSCADAVHATGRDFIVAVVIAYEIFCRLCDQLKITDKGFDQAVYGIISGVIGVAKILGLTQSQAEEALNIALAANIALLQTRVGEVSMWKSSALANAGRNAVFAALLAQKGMTGPRPIFEGRAGFMEVVSGGFELQKFGGRQEIFRIMKTMIKKFPCGQFCQTPVAAALRVRSKLSSVKDLEEINIETCKKGKQYMAGSEEKWHPTNRETADHSIPYTVAVALMFGPPEPKHFGDGYLQQPDLHDLMQKIRVEESEECNQMYPQANASRIEVKTRAGEKYSEFVPHIFGRDPYQISPDQIEEKFNMLTREYLRPDRAEKIKESIWHLENMEDCAKIMDDLSIEV